MKKIIKFTIPIILLLIAFPVYAGSNPTYSGNSCENYQFNTGTISCSITISGSNPIVLVGAKRFNGSPTSVAITLNGNACTNIYSAGSNGNNYNGFSYCYPSGSGSQTVQAVFTGGSSDSNIIASLFNGVNQSNPVDGSSGQNSPTHTLTTITTSFTKTNDTIVAFSDYGPTTGVTNGTYINGDGGNTTLYDSGTTAPTPTSYTMTYGSAFGFDGSIALKSSTSIAPLFQFWKFSNF